MGTGDFTASVTSDNNTVVFTLGLYDANGALIAQTTDAAGLTELLDADGDYLLRVDASDVDAAANYDLAWNGQELTEPVDANGALIAQTTDAAGLTGADGDPVDPVDPVDPTEPTPDAYEDNNALASAYALTGTSGSLAEALGLATATDADWYQVTVGAGDFTASVTSDNDTVVFTLGLYDADGALIAQTTDTAGLAELLDADGDYLLRVDASDVDVCRELRPCLERAGADRAG